MKALCLSIPLLLFIAESVWSHHLNVGTVLFTKGDLCRKCWSDQEKKLLMSRQVMQGVLPDPEYIDISKKGTTTVLLEYFQTCFDVIGQSSCGKRRHLMFLALSDALGGYLRSHILPLTRRAYYAGQIKYAETKQMFTFYDELKDFLRTSGAGWAKPRKFIWECKVRPLRITKKGADSACEQLYFKEEHAESCNFDGLSTTEPQQECPPPTFCPTCDEKTRLRLDDMVRARGNGGHRKTVDFSSADEMNNEDDLLTFARINQTEAKRRRPVPTTARVQRMRDQTNRIRQRLRVSDTGKCTDSDWSNGTASANFSIPVGDLMTNLRKLRRRRRFYCLKRPSKQPDFCEVPAKMSDISNACPGSKNINTGTLIPLPVLDDEERPHAIGLPFKNKPLRSLTAPGSVCILVRYYLTVIKCLLSKGNGKTDVLTFNGEFQSWLVSQIFPHLTDEDWYPAFGGVLRIDETIKIIGAECKGDGKERNNDIGFMFSKGIACDESDYDKNDECEDMGICEEVIRPCRRGYLTAAIMFIVALWIIAFCYCICFYYPTSKSEEECAEERCDVGAVPVRDGKEKTGPTNSFIIQYLVKFFKRNPREEETKVGFVNVEPDYVEQDLIADDAMTECSHRPATPVCGGRSRHCVDDIRRTQRQARETIVLPARISPAADELPPLRMVPAWPFDEFDVSGKSPFDSPRGGGIYPSKVGTPRMNRDQCQTIWKREQQLKGQTSESCRSGVQQESIHQTTFRGSQRGRPSMRDVEERRPSSSFSGTSYSDEPERKTLIYLRRSRSGFRFPARSYEYSCKSSEDSYSSSQTDDEIPVELYDHMVACHNSFTKERRHEVSERPAKLDSDSDRGLITSSSTRTTSSLSPKRRPC